MKYVINCSLYVIPTTEYLENCAETCAHKGDLGPALI